MGADIIALDACGDMPTTNYPLSRPPDLARTVDEVQALGREVFSAEADVRYYADLDAATRNGVSELGRLDIVCANAGIISFGRAHEMTEAAWVELLDINLNGAWRTAKAAIPHILATGNGGSIVFISSAAAMHGVPNIAHYVTAKTGLTGLAKSLSIELASHGIRVNTVNPTNVDTDMIHQQQLYRFYRPDLESPSRTEFTEATRATHPMNVPWVEPVDVSAAVAYLVSDEARYVTGAQLPIMAGRE